MSNRKLLLCIFALSIFGTTLWLFEILGIKGWYGLAWLDGVRFSPFIAAFIVCISFLLPFLKNKEITLKNSISPALILYLVNVLCFVGGKILCFALYCRFCFWTTQDILLLFLSALLLFAVIGFVYWLVTSRLITKIKKRNILYLSLIALLTIPLSLISIRLNTGFGSGTDWIDAVKMGYPIFWITFLLGISGMLLVRQKEKAGSF